MVWNEFWQSGFFNFVDDIPAYLANVPEKVKRDRKHACVAIWCGANEGLSFYDNMIEDSVKKYDMGDRLYQSTSNANNITDNSQFGLQGQGGISSDGGYNNLDLAAYFTKSPSSGHGFNSNNTYTGTYGFHPEFGAACFPTSESFRMFIPPANLWPRNNVWNFDHYFDDDGSVGRGNGAAPSDYLNRINARYGTATGIEDLCRKAQLINIETHKAMYEGYTDHLFNDASGLLMWMSQSAFPTMIWQTYDYYLDCTGAYWGIKKACEPVHIQWNIATDQVKVVNTTVNDISGLTASSAIYDLNGNAVNGFANSVSVSAKSDTTAYCFNALNYVNLALGKPATATSSSSNFPPSNAFDGNLGTRWAANDNNPATSIYVDLGSPQTFNAVMLKWESTVSAASSYKIQVSNDAINWTDVYTNNNGTGNIDILNFAPANGRYVRMQGITRSGFFGYSLYEFGVYNQTLATGTYFIKLQLKDAQGNPVSDNFYWNNPTGDLSALNNLPVIPLQQTESVITLPNGNKQINVSLTNPSNSAGIAFAVHVQLKNADGLTCAARIYE